MRNIVLFFITSVLFSCGNSSITPEGAGSKPADSGIGSETNINTGYKQLNINILWDLSDRIDSVRNPLSPQQYERDIEVIKTITVLFKADMQKKGAYKAKGKLRVFFNPSPQNAMINSVARALVCDLSSYTGDGANRKKKETYDSIQVRFLGNLNLIYQLTVEDNKSKKNWDGSDVWRFFKNDVKEYCIDRDSSYRNILVILTDGYIYHKDSKIKNANRTSYILPEVLKSLRKNSKWKDTFKNGNYGLVATRNDLQSLEILVLEVNPSRDYKDDEDLIKAYFSKWFEEMGVKNENFSLYNTDLPEYTKNKIQNFFNKR
jgi:hypothetical protein